MAASQVFVVTVLASLVLSGLPGRGQAQSLVPLVSEDAAVIPPARGRPLVRDLPGAPVIEEQPLAAVPPASSTGDRNAEERNAAPAETEADTRATALDQPAANAAQDARTDASEPPLADVQATAPSARARAANRRLTPEEIAERRKRQSALAGAGGPLIPLPAPQTDLLLGAELRQLDKMTGRTTPFALTVGQIGRQDRLSIRLDACRASDADAGRAAMAFLTIWDTKTPDAGPVFSGWMFAESPGLSAMDHPRYDLWVTSCTTSSGTVSPPSE